MKPFKGSRIKLRRAQGFIDELESMFIAFSRDDPVKIVQQVVGNELITDWHFKRVPEEVGAVLGDAIHNMRSALDLMACELAILNNKTPEKVSFPICSSAATFKKETKAKNFKRTGAASLRLLESIGPYSDGNSRLYALHQLDLQDKHRALLDTAKEVDSTVRTTFDPKHPEKFKAVLNGHIYHLFPTDSDLSGEPILITLKQIHAIVSGVINSYADQVVPQLPESLVDTDDT